MSGWLLLTLIVLICIFIAFNVTRSGGLSGLKTIVWRRPKPSAKGVPANVRGRNIRTPPRGARGSWRVRVVDAVKSRGIAGGLVFFLIVLLAIGTGFALIGRLSGLFGIASEHPNLVVLIAPFRAPDGSLAPEGASVAEGLLREWSSGSSNRLTRPLQIGKLTEPISDPEAAFNLAVAQRADVVIWGTVEPGGSADSASLRPQLLWWPRSQTPAQRALGTRERLAMPVLYDLAYVPLNGQAVVGQILDTLDMYQQGDFDGALQSINTLLDRYAVDGPLRPDLLLGLRGAIAAMQGQWAGAETDFRRAIEATSPGRPEYWNDLGLALAAQGEDVEALQAFNMAQAEAERGGGDLASIALNRGLLTLRGPDPAAALPDLARAHELRGSGPLTLAALAEAQREANQFSAAVDAINQAQELAPNDPEVALETSRLQLAQLVGEGNHLLWELEIAPPLPQETLNQLRVRLDDAIVGLETTIIAERQQAASEDAAGRPEAGRVHEGAARQGTALLSKLRYWQAVAQTEEGIVAERNKPGGLRGFWNTIFGGDTPLELAQVTTAALMKADDRNYDTLVLAGRVYRLIKSPKFALERYTTASEVDPNRPEAWYGLAITRWDFESQSQQRDDAIREALHKAVAADPAFTPAYLLGARLELRQEQWAAALPYLQWLVDHRPDQVPAHVALGRAQRQLGQLSAAELTLLPLANQNNGSALVELALVYRQAGQDESAASVLQRALSLDAGNAEAAYELGRLLQDHRDYAAAEQAYVNAINANPSYTAAHLALGQLYARHLNQPQLAVQSYQRAIESGDKNAANFADLGREFLEIGQYGEAASALEQSVALDPNVPEARHALGQAYLELGRYDAAREQERAAIARKTDGPYVAAQLGIADSFRRQGRADEAIAAYNEVLDNDLNAVDAYVGLGRTAADKQDWQGAIGYYNQALTRDPSNAGAHFWLGQALVEQGFYERALEEFQVVLAGDPANATAYYGSGRAYSRIAEGLYGVDPTQAASYDAQAREMLNQALLRRPNYPQALLERGILNERQGQIQAAIDDYGQATQLNDGEAIAPYLQGKLYLGHNNVAAATESLETSVRRDPNYPPSLYWLGRAYRAQNRDADAIKSFSRAVSINGGYNEARYFQGLTEEETNQLDAARVSYEAIIAQAPPEDRWRQQAEERLRELRK